jgi:hypothetical protein
MCVESVSCRSSLLLLLHDGGCIGVLALLRKTRAGSTRTIALAKSFVDQA